jgi:hypothetical protein
MCETLNTATNHRSGLKTIPVNDAVGLVLAHDITEIRRDEFKGRAFKKGHIVRSEDICHLQRLGKENLFVLQLSHDEMHENDAARAMAQALMGEGLTVRGEPEEGKITIIADRDGILKVHREALFKFNMLGDVMCATLHHGTHVRKGQTVAGTRAIPLVVKRSVVQEAVKTAHEAGSVISVKAMKKPKAGIVITGNEVYQKKIQDAFAPILTEKINAVEGEIVGIHYAPDDELFIMQRLQELMDAGADLLITTGGMSVDPDDVTRFAIRSLGALELTYGSPVLPGAMFLIGYLPAGKSRTERSNGSRPGNGNGQDNDNGVDADAIPILGIPACGMYAKTTLFDLLLPRVLAGEHIGRRELAEMGHGGLCMKCNACTYPACPFGK